MKVKDLFGKKAEAQAEMFLASLGHLRELKAILSPEQINKMEAQGFLSHFLQSPDTRVRDINMPFRE